MKEAERDRACGCFEVMHIDTLQKIREPPRVTIPDSFQQREIRTLEAACGDDHPLPDPPFELPLNHYHALATTFWFSVLLALSSVAIWWRYEWYYYKFDFDWNTKEGAMPLYALVAAALGIAACFTAATNKCCGLNR